MKTLYSILLLMLISTLAYSQAPEAFNYQAVIRNGAGEVLTNTQVAVQMSLLQDNETGTAVYVERFNPTTTDHGMIALMLGMGTVQSGTFNTIDWGSHSYYLKIEVDPNNGTAFTSMGTSQLLSVPYALYAKSSGGGGGDADADPTNELQTLTVAGNDLTISDGNTVTLPPPADNSITSEMIIDGEVKDVDIATNAVGSDEIRDNAVGSSEIASDAVASDEIATDAVGMDEIAPDAVGPGELADNSVGSDEIEDNAVGSSEIASDAVGSSEIASDAVGASEIATNAVGSSEIAPDAVGASEIAPGAVGASEVANGSLTRLDLLDEPRVEQAFHSSTSAWYSLTSSFTDAVSISAVAPADGYFLVTGTGTFALTKSALTQASWGVDLHTAPDAAPGVSPVGGSHSAARGYIQDTWTFTASMGIPFHLQEVFPVSQGNTYNYYLNARAVNFATAYLFHSMMVVLFIPSSL